MRKFACVFSFVFFATLACGLISHASLGQAAEKYNTTFGLKPFEKKQTLRLGFFAGSPLSIPFYIADKEGFFKELNIEIQYETFTNGPAMVEANSTWDIGGMGVAGALTGMIGYDLKAIAVSDYEVNLALIVRPDSPLAKDSTNPDNWKGTTWLYPIGTTAHATLVTALQNVGLTINDIKSINMDVASALSGFMGGSGDGLGVWNAIAFTAEDKGFVRIGDSGSLNFTSAAATLATPKALKEKKELITLAYIVFYRTWEWCQQNDENMKKAIQHYLENCQDEGIACDLSIAQRVMKSYAAPSFAKSVELMTKASPDTAGIYKKRDLLQAEKDFLVGMDFFVSQKKYTPADREKLLDTNSVDPSIAIEAKTLVESLGLKP